MNFISLALPVDAVEVASTGDVPYSGMQPRSTPKSLEEMRQAQRRWTALSLKQRLRMLRAARHAVAKQARQLAACVPGDQPGQLHRTPADTLAAEILPWLEACRFLEREATSILAPQRSSSRSRPFWLSDVSTVVHRVPVGVVLILAPGNYPLFLPGVQLLQALAAGNAVLWKPAPGGAEVAHALKKIFCGVGFDPGLIQVLDPTVEAGIGALALGANKVFLTGSSTTGQSVMRLLADTLTPSVMELSGCDAVFVLDGVVNADLERAAEAIAFGLRFNGSATCMAPRRLFATHTVTNNLLPRLFDKLSALQPVPVPPATARKLDQLVDDAVNKGARIILDGRGTDKLLPTILDYATPQMLATQTDIFAPLLSILRVAGKEEAEVAYAQCPYALTVAIFGPSADAEALARGVIAGNVLINDVIVSTADPRAPFGGRGRSGFGTTRGREGLLEMTAVKTIQTQRSRGKRSYQPTTPSHIDFFLGIINASHGEGLGQRLRGLKQLFRAAGKIK